MRWEQKRSNKALFLLHSFFKKKRKTTPSPLYRLRERERVWERRSKKSGNPYRYVLKGRECSWGSNLKSAPTLSCLKKCKIPKFRGKERERAKEGDLTRKGFGIKTAFFTNLQFIPRNEEKKNTTGCLRKKRAREQEMKNGRETVREKWKSEISVV